jgi:MoaA/NifB/PqqE/SkfB family radical SAM enzyme
MHFYEKISLGSAFCRSLISYHFDFLTHKPYSASFFVTNECNLHCSYCPYLTFDKKILSLSEIEYLFAKLYKIGIRRLGLSGGEPLVRKDIGEIIHLAKRTGFYVTLNTNLLLYSKLKNKLDKVDFFFTSLDGDENSHIKNRGKNSYTGVLDAIDDILQSGKNVVPICVVTEDNLDQMPILLKQADEHGFRMHFQSACTNPETNNKNSDTILLNKKFQQFWKELLKAKESGGSISNSKKFIEFMINWKDHSKTAIYDPSKRCAAVNGYLFINPQGQAFPCPGVIKKTKSLNLLKNDWVYGFYEKIPCSTCKIGPMLEFNLLFEHPASSVINAFKSF